MVLAAPLEVRFDEDNRVEPDLVYVAPERHGIIQEARIFGAPDLLVEILSRRTDSSSSAVSPVRPRRKTRIG